MDSISPIDEFGFQVSQHFYWIPETTDSEIIRLEMNLLKYEQYLLSGSRFPEHINRARMDDFNRLQALKLSVA